MSLTDGDSKLNNVDGQERSKDLELLNDRIGIYELAARRFEDLFHGLPVACYTYDAEGNIHDWNAAATELWGYEGHVVVQRSIYDTVFSEEDSSVRRKITEQVLKGKHVKSLEVRSATVCGEPRWTLTCEMPQYSSDGKVVGGLSANIDISDRKLAEAALASSENLLRTAYEVLQNGVMIIDSAFRVEVCNPSACDILGIKEIDLVGKQLRNVLFSPKNEDGSPMMDEDMPSYRSAKHGEFCKDTVMGITRQSDKETIWINVKSSPIIQDGSSQPSGAVVSFSDITQRLAHVQMIEQNLQQINDLYVTMELQQLELEDANAKLENLANVDGLTGVANHRAFQDYFERQIEISHKTGRDLSLLFLDVDLFKSFNDDYGHQIGDEVLLDVAKVIALNVRDTDFPARYGGEEFVVVLPGAKADAALRVAESVRKKIESHDWKHRTVTVSVGVATLNKRDITKDEMVEEADKALYHAKDAGRNKSLHYNDLSHESSNAA